MNLFYEVAFRFFREAGSHSEHYYERRAELDRLDKARKRRAALISTRRSLVARGLTEFEEALDAGRPAEEVAHVVQAVEAGLAQAVAEPDPTRAAETVARVEDRAREQLRAADEAFRVERPRGMALSRPLARRYARYEDERARLEQELLEPTRARIDKLIADTVAKHELALARRLRLEHAVAAAVRTARDKTKGAQRELNLSANDTSKKAKALGQRHSRDVEEAAARVQAELAGLDVSKTSDPKLVAFRARIERELAGLRETATASLSSMTQQIGALVWPENGTGPTVTALDQIEALETDLETLSEQAADQMEVTQLGMAVEVINHEFRHTVQSIRRTLRQLKVWADANPKLRAPYTELKTSFDHLDGYLALFTPLQRRLHRTEVEIVGNEIESFLRELFQKRLVDNEIELVATDTFREHVVTGYPSTLYPVFVNLVDNAVYWLSSYRGGRRIVLDAGADWMAVRDTGPGLPVDLGDDVFAARVTTKPGGSGYGLFIARQVLEREGMRLISTAPSVDEGAELRILESAS